MLKKLFTILFLSTIIFGATQMVEPSESLAKLEMAPGYSTPASLKLDGGCNFFLSGTFLYYQATEANLEIAYIDELNTDPDLGNGSTNLIHYQMDFDYKPAFKVGADYRFKHDKWEIGAEYMWYHIKDHVHYNLNSAVLYLFPFMTGLVGNYSWNNNDATSATWRLKMDVGDLFLSRPFYSGEKLIFKPLFGLRLLFMDQHFNQTIASHLDNGTAYTPYYHGKNKSWSIGPRAGLGTEWKFTKNFRLFGNAAGNLSYSKYKISYHSFEEYDENETVFFSRSFKRSYLSPMGELQLGLGYGAYFNNYKLHLDLSASYDVYVLWHQEMLRYEEYPGDLYLQGLAVRAEFDF